MWWISPLIGFVIGGIFGFMIFGLVEIGREDRQKKKEKSHV